MDKLLSFDIETNIDPTNRRLLCAATARSDSPEAEPVVAVFTEESHGEQFAAKFCAHLLDMATAGYRVCSWNGAAFDFAVLAKLVPGMADTLIALCVDHHDPCVIIHCTLGYPVKLDSCARYMLGETKKHEVVLSDGETVINDMGGAMAETYWDAGETDAVIEYLRGDVLLTLKVMRLIVKNRAIQWFSKNGKPMAVKAAYPAGDYYRLDDALRLPRPDVNWMDPKQREGLARETFWGWMFDGELP